MTHLNRNDLNDVLLLQTKLQALLDDTNTLARRRRIDSALLAHDLRSATTHLRRAANVVDAVVNSVRTKTR